MGQWGADYSSKNGKKIACDCISEEFCLPEVPSLSPPKEPKVPNEPILKPSELIYEIPEVSCWAMEHLAYFPSRIAKYCLQIISPPPGKVRPSKRNRSSIFFKRAQTCHLVIFRIFRFFLIFLIFFCIFFAFIFRDMSPK